MAARKPPLWTCPKCGAKFVTRNIWHGCGDYSVEGFLKGKGERARQLFFAYVDFVRSIGPVTVVPTKSRVAIMVRVRFAGVSRVSDRGITIGFAQRRPIKSPRIQRVENPVPRWFTHAMRIKDASELDAELLRWHKAAYRIGTQEG